MQLVKNYIIQIFANDEHRGGYDEFFEARESELPFSWLRLQPKEGSQESRMVRALLLRWRKRFVNVLYIFLLIKILYRLLNSNLKEFLFLFEAENVP